MPSQPPHRAQLASVVHRNIRTLLAFRKEAEARMRWSERLADAISRFTGNIAFFMVHSAVFASWISLNLFYPESRWAFDPRPFPLLGTFACIESIFLMTFVLISQNRARDLVDDRSALDLQVNLLAEHEVTHLVTLAHAIADHLGVSHGLGPQAEELKAQVSPETVLEEMQIAKERETQKD